jgi:hypothetical protein
MKTSTRKNEGKQPTLDGGGMCAEQARTVCESSPGLFGVKPQIVCWEKLEKQMRRNRSGLGSGNNNGLSTVQARTIRRQQYQNSIEKGCV